MLLPLEAHIPPPNGTKFWRIGPKVHKTQEKCQNPPCWRTTNVPERYDITFAIIFGSHITTLSHRWRDTTNPWSSQAAKRLHLHTILVVPPSK